MSERSMRLIRLAIIGSAANLALPLSALITGPLLARALDPAGRGVLSALLVPVSLANYMLTAGLPETLGWHTARGRVTKQRASLVACFGGCLVGLIGAAALICLGPWLLHGEAARYQSTYNLLALTLPITLSFAGLRGIVFGQQNFLYVNAEQLVGVFGRLAAMIVVLLMGGLDPVNAAWITVMSGIAGSAVLLVCLLRKSDFTLQTSAKIGSIIGYARTAALGTLGELLIIRLDQLLMIPLVGAQQLGFYAIAVSIAELPHAAVGAVGDLIFGIGAREDLPHLAARSCRLTLLILCPVCLVLGLVTGHLLPLMFGRRFEPAIPMAQVLLIGSVFGAVGRLLGTGLLSMGKPGIRAVIQVSGAALTAMLVVLLVPAHGGLGAAWATTITYTAIALATLSAYSRCGRVSFRDCLIPTAGEFAALKDLLANLLAGRGRRTSQDQL